GSSGSSWAGASALGAETGAGAALDGAIASFGPGALGASGVSSSTVSDGAAAVDWDLAASAVSACFSPPVVGDLISVGILAAGAAAGAGSEPGRNVSSAAAAAIPSTATARPQRPPPLERGGPLDALSRATTSALGSAGNGGRGV